MKKFTEIHAWRGAVELYRDLKKALVHISYSDSRTIGHELCRTCISISSNIAEASAYPSRGQTVRFLTYGLGSAFEFESQLYLLGLNSGGVDTSELVEKTIKVQVMLSKLIKRINSKGLSR